MTPAARCALTRTVSFHATHRFPTGAHAHRHGHLYRVACTVGGALDPAHRVVIDLALLDTILTEEIVNPLAGRHLNDVIEEFASGETPPSCEALAAWCWTRVAARLPAAVHLHRVRVAEDETLWADCTGVE